MLLQRFTFELCATSEMRYLSHSVTRPLEKRGTSTSEVRC